MIDPINHNVRTVRVLVESNTAIFAALRRLAAGVGKDQRSAALTIGKGPLPVIATSAAAEENVHRAAGLIRSDADAALRSYGRVTGGTYLHLLMVE